MQKFNIDYSWVDSFWDKIVKKLSVVAPKVDTPFPYFVDENEKYKAIAENVEKEIYIGGAIKLLKWLEANCDFTMDNQFILQNGCVDYHNETNGLPIIYGDYYMMEALLNLKGNELLFW